MSLFSMRLAHAARLLRLPALVVLLLCSGFAPAWAAAPSCTDRDNLLPVEEAFVFSAEAKSADRIELHWKIAPSCYLYRHQLRIQADAGFAAGAPQIPAGAAHVDEYFGRVETYRNTLTVVLPGKAQAASTTLKVRYQGCADAGICYPPQTRSIVVALPGAAASATASSAAQDEPVVAFGNNTARGVPLAGGLLGKPGSGAVDVEPLPPEQAFAFEAIVGDGNTLLLRFTPAQGYYLYRDKTSFKLDAAASTAGIAAGRAKWPPGVRHHDEHFGDVIVYFDSVDVPLPLQRTRADAAKLTLTTTFQGCQTNGICYPPMTRAVTLDIPAGKITPVDAATPATTVAAVGDESATSAPTAQSNPQGDNAARQSAPASRDTAVAPRGNDLSLFSALLFALLGGLVLNLMPCVLPVLSLKALSLAGNGEDPARARKHALWYTAGVLLSFLLLGGLALGLRQAGLALGWGFQLQQPLVVALLALLMFGLGLSMSGVWHVGGRWTGMGHALTTKSGPLGDFFTGVLAVVVATPCTAPLMGPALAWAFLAPTANALLVFLMLGLGLALPFLVIGFVPALAHRLPRPGAWMETFKQALAFPLYLTAAWLAWVLARQRGVDAMGWWLLAAVLLAFAAWAWTRARTTGHRWAMIAAALAALALIWPLHAIHTMPRASAATALVAPNEAIVPVPYSEQRLADLRAGGRVVFVNVTADWCVTCKVNERAVFRGDGFRDAMAQANAVYMVGDWTDVDPALTAFLQRYKAVGVPLYVVFPRNGGEGTVLPVVLTTSSVQQALQDAAR